MPESISAPVTRAPRDPRLDVFRGLALVMIYINHVPGTIYEFMTSRNFGQSDAAEAFVMMSGIAAGLAYSGSFRNPPYWPGTARVWHRSWTLYLMHIFMTMWSLAIAALAARWLGGTHRLFVNEMAVLFDAPLGFLVGVPLLTHQLGYVNILPMYAFLLMITPALLWVALRRPWWLALASLTFWLVVGLYEWDLPNYPNAGGWFFNPLAWQVLFIAGLLTGVFARQGKRFIPVYWWLQLITAAILVAGFVWAKIPAIGEAWTQALWQANQNGVHRFWTYADKTYVTWPRLIHILALAYLLSTLPIVRRAAGSKLAAPLALLGRQALPVFVMGSLLALAAQALKESLTQNLAIDTALIFGGILLQLGFAYAKDRLSLKSRG
ncbi:MAG: OpgC domain-containing protein [Cereibacter sphaeroides]|uniref:OpgC domain-containing protein n=1 Tax=Cereibacter sphaeroides TaxID=1063 RepID=A0A2W5RZ12_CERSP|nr:MAG: OpgC domain-containing protein [Cereibacter sphaeroides]